MLREHFEILAIFSNEEVIVNVYRFYAVKRNRNFVDEVIRREELMGRVRKR